MSEQTRSEPPKNPGRTRPGEEELLGHILKISRQMVQIRSLEPLLAFTIEEVIKLVGAEQGFIVFLSEDGSLDFKAKRNREGHDLPGEDDLISRTILKEVIETKQPILLRDAMRDPRFAVALSVQKLRLLSIMCVPLIVSTQAIGAIYVENRSVSSRFTETDLGPLQIFANQAAVALENAALNDRLQIETEQEKLRLKNEYLERQAAELAKLNASKDHFFSIVSHDLRTPFTVLLNGATLLLDNISNLTKTEIQVGVENIHSAAQSAYGLLENLLTWARMQRGHMPFQLQEDDLAQVAQNSISLLAEAARQKGIAVDQLIPPGIIVHVDHNMLDAIIRNLLNNAIKFTPFGGKVVINARPVKTDDKSWAEVAIFDTGVGIPADILPGILELSIEHSTYGTHNEQGSGLGLILSKEMVERHGGKIWIESILNQGTTVHFTVPLLSEWPKIGKPFGSSKLLRPKATLFEFTLPPEEQLIELHQLLQQGDLLTLQKHAGLIRQRDPELHPFADEVIRLAAAYRVNELRQFLERFIEKNVS